MYITRIIASFVNNRSFAVRAAGILSSVKGIPAGLPQGSALSPELYSIYTADLPIPKDVTVLTYADDTALIATAKQGRAITRRLSNAFSKIESYLERWHIAANVDKTQFLFVPPDRKKCRLPRQQLIISGHQIDKMDSIKYLGVPLTVVLISKNTSALCASVSPLSSVRLSHCSRENLSRPNRMLLIKQICFPTITYAASAWADITATDGIYLRRGFSMAAKKILRLPIRTPSQQLYDEKLCIPFIESLIKDARPKLLTRLHNQNDTDVVVALANTIRSAWP